MEAGDPLIKDESDIMYITDTSNLMEQLNRAISKIDKESEQQSNVIEEISQTMDTINEHVQRLTAMAEATVQVK